jgi:phosphinothricin acetyltransferase
VDISIRSVRKSDAQAIASIYAYHVLHGTASYEVDPPSPEDTLAKIRRITESGWPFLVAQVEEEIIGYAYATQFRDRAAYRYTCEDSIYINAGMTGRGAGQALLVSLIGASAECGFRTMVAVIGGAEPASIALHAKCGFEHRGCLKAVGFKFGSWLDSVYMQRDLPT